MITYTKNYTRDNSLILQDGWGKGFVDGFEKWDKKKNPYSPINIYYVKDSVVEIWDSKEGFDWFFNKLTEKNKQDPNFFENITKTYKSYLDKINVFKKKKIITSINEFKDFIKILHETIKNYIIFYHSAMNDNTPEDIRKIALKMREEDSLFDDCNIIVRESLSHLFPRIKGMELVIIPTDLDNMPSNKELEQRMNNFVFIPKVSSEIIQIKDFLNKNPNYNFVYDKVGKETLDFGIIRGSTAFAGYAKGKVRILKRKNQIKEFIKGEIIVSPMTTVEFEPAMKKSGAIVTDEGGITCHAGIISRELKIPCVIGTKIATKVLKDGDLIEVDADKGIIKILEKSNKKD